MRRALPTGVGGGRRLGLLGGRNISLSAGAGLLVVIVFILAAVCAPLLSPFPPTQANLSNRLLPPVWQEGGKSVHPLGTDTLGRDILSRLLHGSRIPLIVGSITVLLSTVIGVSLGLLAAYFGGWVDNAIMRLVDLLLSIPNVLLYLTALGVFGPSLMTLILVLGLINWTRFARVVRAEALANKEREYIEAAKASGLDIGRMLFVHMLPNIMGPIIVLATLNVSTIIILESTLSFLGLGVQPPSVTWGQMLASGRDYLATAWWLSTLPGVLITTLCLALLAVGDWLRDALDPRAS